MVLAFVGAGIITMQNALAVILGANLGTTVTGWIISLVGFKMNIESLALPVAGIAGLGFAIFNNQTKWYNWSRFFLGFSFLFLGLGYMKTGIEDIFKHVELQQFENSPAIVFLLIGFIITSIIQSSSATVAITLSALYTGAINLFDATAIILGSEIGTTMKLFVASIKGVAAKRRVAFGNFIFNSITVILVFIFLAPVNRFITDVVGIKDDLIALVFFQSLVNIFGIILFYPLLNIVSRFLEKRFKAADEETMFIHKVASKEPSMALFALEEESKHFMYVGVNFALGCFEIPDRWKKEIQINEKILERTVFEKYEHIKFLYGEIHSYYIQLQKSITDKEDTERLDRLISSVRNGMYAAKSFKDALPDKEQIHNSSNDIKFEFYNKTRQEVEKFCERIFHLMQSEEHLHSKELASLYKSVTVGYTSTLQYLYKEGTAGHVSETEITTMLNFNREIFTAFKSLLFAIKDYLLDKEQSKYFDELPGFIR
jgi:phosphate:Na+ symporter